MSVRRLSFEWLWPRRSLASWDTARSSSRRSPRESRCYRVSQVDASAYDAIALDLSNSRSLDAIPPLQPPGFVLFLGAVFSVFGHTWIAGRFALWTCLAIATVLSALLARRVYRNESAGWLAALLCASSPALRGYAGTLQYELVAAVLLLVLILATVRQAEGRSNDRWRHVGGAALLGGAIGVAALTREVFVVVAPVLSLYLFGRRAVLNGIWCGVVTAMVCLGCAALPLLAWSGLQSSRAGRVVTVSDKGPLVMAFGNNPLANGTFNAPLVGVGTPSGWAFIKAYPRQAAWLAVRKGMYFWGLLRDGWNVPRPAAVALANVGAGAIPLQWILPWARGGWLLVAFGAALLTWRRETWLAWWFAPATVLAIMAVHVATISSYRFAIPALPVVMAIAAGPLSRVVTAFDARRTMKIAVVAVLLCAVLMQTRSWPITYELQAHQFDGFSAENRVEGNEEVRFVDASRGRRAALLLTDEYLPAGWLTIHMRVRARGADVQPLQPLLNVRLSTLAGEPICEHVVTASQLRPEQPAVELPCRLVQGGATTFIAETLGVSDLEFGAVRFESR